MTIKQSVRNEVLAKQRNKCNRCEKDLDMRAVHHDHIRPRSQGGGDEVDNVQALCPTCHSKKTHEDGKIWGSNKKETTQEEEEGFDMVGRSDSLL